jgi:hypothetical protein
MTIPLYADLDDTEYPSTVGKKANRTRRRPHRAACKKRAQPMPVQSNVGHITYLAMDLDKTSSRLNAAKIAIWNKNDQAAEDSLSAIGTNLVAASVATDLPLVTAREDLALARTALNAKNNQAATADLHQASQALPAYAASGPRAADAKKLSGEIDATAGTTATPGYRRCGESGPRCRPMPSRSRLRGRSVRLDVRDDAASGARPHTAFAGILVLDADRHDRWLHHVVSGQLVFGGCRHQGADVAPAAVAPRPTEARSVRAFHARTLRGRTGEVDDEK